jgi:hypothetical protein
MDISQRRLLLLAVRSAAFGALWVAALGLVLVWGVLGFLAG